MDTQRYAVDTQRDAADTQRDAVDTQRSAAPREAYNLRYAVYAVAHIDT